MHHETSLGAIRFHGARAWMRTVIAIVALQIMTVVPGRGQTNPLDENAVSTIEGALRAEQLDRALELSQRDLKAFPKDHRIWTLQGVAYSSKGNMKLGLASFQRALQLHPHYLAALEGEAQIEFANGHYDAKGMLEQILHLRPEDETANAMLAAIEYQQRDCTNAIRHFQNAHEVLNDEPRALTEFGVCLTNSGQFDKAVSIFQRVVRIDDADVAAKYNLAVVELRANKPADALALLDPLTQTGDGSEYVLALAADIHESKGETDTAVTLLREAIAEYPDNPDAYLRLAMLCLDHGALRDGLKVLDAALTKIPKQPSLYLARGILRCQLGEIDPGLADFEEANDLDPQLSFPGMAEGIAEMQNHNTSGAIAAFRADARKHPQDAFAQYLLAEALSESSVKTGTVEFQEELHAAQLAVKEDRDLLMAHDLLATIYFRTGRIDSAIAESREALRVNPKDQQALYRLVLAMRKTERKGEMTELLSRLMKDRNETEASEDRARRSQLIQPPASTASR